MNEPQRMYGYKEAAELIGVETRTLRQMVADGRFPEPHKAGGMVRWFASQIAEWQFKYAAGKIPDPPPKKKR